MVDARYGGVFLERIIDDNLFEVEGDTDKIFQTYINSVFSTYKRNRAISKGELNTLLKEVDMMVNFGDEYGVDVSKISDYLSLKEQVYNLRDSLDQKKQIIYNGKLMDHDFNPIELKYKVKEE